MSIAPVVDAIGVFSGILTTIGFFQSNFPAKQPEGPTVRIKAGLPELDKEGDSLGGSISHVWSFDERNGYGGQSDGCDIGSGGICDKTVNQEVGGRRARYISIANNNDATCISWISVEQFDGTSGGAWTGDIGYNCGQDWYNSVEKAGRFSEEQGGGDYIPKCTWLDGDHTNDIANSALKFDVEAYGEKVLDTAGKDACAPTIYGPDNDPIAGAPGQRKRSARERPQWMANNLVVSNYTSQPAAELCNSDTSYGPDFIGSDGQFCDMGTKTLTPLCSSEDVEGCVEVDEAEGKLVKRMRVARRATNVVHKTYTKVHNWGN